MSLGKQKECNHSVGKHIICDPDKCTGCQLCMFACSFRYARKFSPMKSMIHIVTFHPLFNIAVACQHCKEPDCVRVCPTEALSQCGQTGRINIDKDKCSGCGWCVKACPYGAMSLDVDSKLAFTCDLCEGEDRRLCLEFCPSGALREGNFEEFQATLEAYINKGKLWEISEIERWINEWRPAERKENEGKSFQV